MSDPIIQNATMTFTIKKDPPTSAVEKTIRRLMRMQPEIQKGLRMLARRRRQKDNVTTIRAGRPWTNRAKATKLTQVKVGETFTIRVTPHILPDVASVAAYLDFQPAS